MLDRGHVENFLRLNGIEAAAPDEVIRSALMRANWHQDDVEIALMVLRENVVDHTSEVTTIHKVFRSDETLAPETISSLLGIDLKVHRTQLRTARFDEPRTISDSSVNIIAITVVTCITVGCAFALMYFFSVGPFYSPV